MLNVKDPVIKKFIADTHDYVERRHKKLSDSSEYAREVRENRLIKLMCDDWTREPRRYAEDLNRDYGYNLLGDDIIQIFRRNRFTVQDKRNTLFELSADAANAFGKALSSHTQADYDNYMSIRKNAIQAYKSRISERVICIMLYKKNPEINTGKDFELMERFGNVFTRYFLYDISDLLKATCSGKSKGNSRDEKKDSNQEKIELLENMLNRSDMLLKDLQDEFEARIKESHQDDLVEFFSRLNSDKYGCILDAVLSARNGVRKLRKEKVQLQPEISGLFILIEQLANFIRDSEINPILKLGAVKDMRLDEVENCDYEGSPFLNNTEIKRVKVLSPGWVYKDKDVQIARPRLKEVVGG